MPPIAIVLLGCCAVVALDAAGALLASRRGFDYARLAPVSLLLYALFGFLAAGAAGQIVYGSFAGAAAAAVDATVGWRVSRALGAGERHVPEHVEIGTATVVTLLGAVIGTVAGALAGL
jgi:hypothetical protein